MSHQVAIPAERHWVHEEPPSCLGMQVFWIQGLWWCLLSIFSQHNFERHGQHHFRPIAESRRWLILRRLQWQPVINCFMYCSPFTHCDCGTMRLHTCYETRDMFESVLGPRSVMMFVEHFQSKKNESHGQHHFRPIAESRRWLILRRLQWQPFINCFMYCSPFTHCDCGTMRLHTCYETHDMFKSVLGPRSVMMFVEHFQSTQFWKTWATPF